MNLSINPKLVVSTLSFTFIEVPSMYEGFFDIIYKNERIAILNGLSAPLQWTAKNGSNIAISVIEELENIVKKLIEESHN